MGKFSTILTISLITLLSGGCGFFKKSPTEIAQNVTVSIDRCASGSGVLYRQIGNTYYVLTTKHNLEGTNIDRCVLITPDGVKHGIKVEPTFTIEKVDLAVVVFSSDNSYETAQLGNSDEASIGKIVYIGGFPAVTQTVGRVLRVSEGKIIGRDELAEAGYTLIYDNTTLKGMSGGPVLDEGGRVVGIHGRWDSGSGSKESYGIPIKKFASFQFVNLEKPIPAVYIKLRYLLQAGEWKEADLETRRVMLIAVGREEEGWWRNEDIENFPCEDMRIIDQLWVKYSNGRFGFSVQRSIWERVGGNPDANYETYERFGDAVGWQQGGQVMAYSQLTFETTAPRGQLPIVMDATAVFGPARRNLFSRTGTCNL